MQAACRAYLSARAELGVLLPLRHPNIAPLLAACTAPLALVLALAPMVSYPIKILMKKFVNSIGTYFYESGRYSL